MREFKEMTLREVDLALKNIQRRTHNAFALRASLHGHKIPLMQSASREAIASPEKAGIAEELMKRALEQRRAK